MADGVAPTDPAPPVLRRATVADAHAVAACVDDAYRFYIARIGQPPGPMLDDYPQVLGAHPAWLYEHRGRVVGVVVLMLDAHRALLENVAIHPDYQGRGWGRRLISLAEQESLRLGYRSIELYTHEKMTENLALYTRLGYVEFDRRTEHGLHRVYLRKELPASP